jgi:hypothetical protein
MGIEGGIEPVASDSSNSSDEETSDEDIGMPWVGSGENTSIPLPAHPTPVLYKKTLKSKMHAYLAVYWVEASGGLIPMLAAYRSRLFVTVDYYERETVVRIGDFWDTSALTRDQMLFRTVYIYASKGFYGSYNRWPIRGGSGNNAFDYEPELRKNIPLILFGRPIKVTLATSVIAYAPDPVVSAMHTISLYF